MQKNSFAEIYNQWENTHDEKTEILRRISSTEKESVHKKTINEIRHMKVQDELDLHNYLLDEAIHQTEVFIEQSEKRGLNKIRIVTGKGLHSPNCESVIRPAVIAVVKASKYIREYDLNPKPEDGGSGAVIVILK